MNIFAWKRHLTLNLRNLESGANPCLTYRKAKIIAITKEREKVYYGNVKRSLQKIEEIMSEVGKCNIDFKVNYDNSKHCWALDLQESGLHLKIFIEDVGAEDCLAKEKCILVGLQIGQLKENLKMYHQSATSNVP